MLNSKPINVLLLILLGNPYVSIFFSVLFFFVFFEYEKLTSKIFQKSQVFKILFLQVIFLFFTIFKIYKIEIISFFFFATQKNAGRKQIKRNNFGPTKKSKEKMSGRKKLKEKMSDRKKSKKNVGPKKSKRNNV